MFKLTGPESDRERMRCEVGLVPREVRPDEKSLPPHLRQVGDINLPRYDKGRVGSEMGMEQRVERHHYLLDKHKMGVNPSLSGKKTRDDGTTETQRQLEWTVSAIKASGWRDGTEPKAKGAGKGHDIMVLLIFTGILLVTMTFLMKKQ
jgi:hypothetical protein